ncbi:uncharacterized protein (DUF58 family) [Pedobacter sp. UYEF25]
MQHPKLETEINFGNLEILANLVVEGFITGLHKSPFHGFSVEFAEHRQYNVGDSVKNIDWKLYAKTDKLYSKRYEEETNLRCQFIIDVSSSMYFPEGKNSKLAFSVRAAAALMMLLKRQRDAFGLSLFTDEIILNADAKSTTAHQKFLFNQMQGLLDRDEKSVKTNISYALHQLADLVHKRSLIVVFSDLLTTDANSDLIADFFSSLQHLKFNKHEVIIFNVLDKGKEIEFDFENRPHQFVDMETNEVVKVHASRVKESYKKAIDDYRQKIALKCNQYKIDLIDADVAEGYFPVLQHYLIKRQKMN